MKEQETIFFDDFCVCFWCGKGEKERKENFKENFKCVLVENLKRKQKKCFRFRV